MEKMELAFTLLAGFFAGTAIFMAESDAAVQVTDLVTDGSGIFPLSLQMPSTMLHKLTDGRGEESGNILRDQMSKLIMDWLKKNNQSDSMISVEQGDIVMSQSFPDQDFSPSDSRRAEATGINARGALLRSTLLAASGDVLSGTAHLEVISRHRNTVKNFFNPYQLLRPTATPKSTSSCG